MTKATIPCWTYKENGKWNDITDVSLMPENTIGFVYMIWYTDGKGYIGKKNIYSYRKLPALKSGKIRENAVRIAQNIAGKRIYFDRLKKESDWKTYNGSHIECKTRIPSAKRILAFAFNKLQLTYLEAKYLFEYSVLEDMQFINDNILGTFYRSNLKQGDCKDGDESVKGN